MKLNKHYNSNKTVFRKYRVEQRNFHDLKKWINDTKEVPLEKMSAFFNSRVGEYEEHMSRWSMHYKWMASFIPSETKTILDIGCGTGLELDDIYIKYPSVNVTGIDMAEYMLNKLREKHCDKNLELICSDYLTYDIGTEKYDTVISFESLHHLNIAKKTEMFNKIYKSLKHGGVYLECDYIAVSQRIEDLLFSELARKRVQFQISDDEYVHFDTPLTIQHEINSMRSGGFDKVELIGFLPNDDHTPLIIATKN